MNLALQGLSYIADAIEETQLSRIKTIEVKYEPGDTETVIQPHEFLGNTTHIWFFEPIPETNEIQDINI